jgi:hypothetical protein
MKVHAGFACQRGGVRGDVLQELHAPSHMLWFGFLARYFRRPLLILRNYRCADLEWKITYVGSAESEKHDQVLDTVFVGPVSPGQYRFVFQVGSGSMPSLVTQG